MFSMPVAKRLYHLWLNCPSSLCGLFTRNLYHLWLNCLWLIYYKFVSLVAELTTTLCHVTTHLRVVAATGGCNLTAHHQGKVCG